MKNLLVKVLICSGISTLGSHSFAQNVGIGTNSPNASAKLEITDPARGILIPRVALVNVTNNVTPVATPATGLMVYNTNAAVTGGTGTGFYFWDGTQWQKLNSGAQAYWSLTGNTGTNAATNFIGTTNAIDFVTRTNNTERMRVTSGGNVGIGTPTPGYRLDLANGTFAFGNANVRTETRDNAGLQGNAGAQSGFFETVSPSNYPAGASSWWHLIDVRHSNNTNNYALQISGSFFDQELWFRKTNGSATTAWSRLLSSSNFNTFGWSLLGNTGTNAANNFIGTTDAVDFVTRTSNTERMRVTSAGNVGIGINAPAARLHVAGGAIRPESGNVAAAGINFGANVFGGGGDEAFIRYFSEAGENTKLIIANQNDADDDITMEAGFMVFRTGDGGAIPDADRMIITTAGNVGIATAAPAVRFAVGGNGANIYGTDAWIENNLHVQGNETMVAGGRGRLRVGSAWGYSGLYTEGTSTGVVNDLVLGASSGIVRIGPNGAGQNLLVNGETRIQNNSNVLRRATNPIIFTDQFDGTNPGIYIGNSEVEEGGFWANGNYAMIMSPGDNDLVKFVDEDGLDNTGSTFDNGALRARIDGAGQYFQVSDRNAKSNINKLNNGLSKVLAINGYSYDFKQFPDEIAKGQAPIHSVGIIAQEVEKVLPEAVSNTNGDYMVNYNAFVPLFIEAIKEQQTLIEEQRKLIDEMLKEIQELKEKK